MKKIFQLILFLLLTVAVQAQIKFPDHIEHYSSSDYLIDQNQKKGGYWVVANEAARNAIPEAKRLVGMFVTYTDGVGETVTRRFAGSSVIDAQWTDNQNWIGLIASSKIDSLQFNSVNKPAQEEGSLFYDNETKSIVFENDIPTFSHNLGYELVTRVYNLTSDTIKDGKVVRLSGNYKDNGRITSTIKLAGIGRKDSAIVLGLATVDVPPNEYGIALLKGEAKGLNTSMCTNDTCIIYLSSNGDMTDTPPEPPLYAVQIGQVYYADADSGRVFFAPNPATFTPSPHISGDSARYNQPLAITQDVFSYIPISDMKYDDQIGFTLVGDSIYCEVNAHISVAFNMSYIGNAQSDIWRIGGFLNGVEQNSVSRSTSSTSVGNSTLIYTSDIVAGDWISFKMTNESADRDPTISDFSFEVIFLSEK